MTRKKATRRSSSYDASKARTSQGTTTRQSIAQDYNKGTLIAAVIMSLFFGAAILMWAVASV